MVDKIRVFLAVFSSLLINFAIYSAVEKIFNNQFLEYKVKFSPVENSFILSTFDLKTKFTIHEINGTKIEEEDYFFNLPFDFYYYLNSVKNFPQMFDFFENDTSLITLNSQTTDIKREDYAYKNFPLIGIFETKPKYLRLTYPNFFYDFEKKEVIDINTLEINVQKTDEFRNVFKKFNFPLKKYYQNNTIMKTFDDGVFLVDSKNLIWHLKQINDKLYLKNTNLIKNPLFIKIDENQRFEYHALLVCDDEIGLISYEDYKFIKFDIEQDFSKFDINYEVTPLHKIITLSNENKILTYVFNPDYTFYKSYFFDKNRKINNIKSFFMPLKLEIKNQKYEFYFGKISYKMLLLNILIAIFPLFKKDKFGAIFVLMFGFGGLISNFIYGRKK